MLAAAYATHCLACLREFHVRCRLLAHLRNAPACFTAITAALPPPPPDDLAALLAADKAACRHRRGAATAIGPLDLPMVRLAGPLPRWAAAPTC